MNLFAARPQTTGTGMFGQNVTTSFTQLNMPQEMNFTNVLPTVSGSTAIPATSLPDPSTFFDTIGPEPQIGPTKSNIMSTSVLTDAIDGLSIKVNQSYILTL